MKPNTSQSGSAKLKLTPQLAIYSLLCIACATAPLLLGWSREWQRPAIWLMVVLGYRWLEQAGYSPRRTAGQRKGEWLFYAIYLGFSGSILLPAVEFAFIQRPVSLLLSATGVVLAALGAWSRHLSVKTIGEHFSTHVEVRPGHELVDSGIMSFIRHPGYTGAMLFTLGGALVLQSYYSLLYVCLFYWPLLFIRIVIEERELSANLAGYSEYRKRTKRLIPFVF
ncbi:MAG: isoprenylcysteine carboxylmethyltransferase family protein [Acidipila sp.]|nr:isoprenylcysteine carboxylmethyltransferase family protein [Acidipila sp.]